MGFLHGRPIFSIGGAKEKYKIHTIVRGGGGNEGEAITSAPALDELERQ